MFCCLWELELGVGLLVVVRGVGLFRFIYQSTLGAGGGCVGAAIFTIEGIESTEEIETAELACRMNLVSLLFCSRSTPDRCCTLLRKRTPPPSLLAPTLRDHDHEHEDLAAIVSALAPTCSQPTTHSTRAAPRIIYIARCCGRRIHTSR